MAEGETEERMEMEEPVGERFYCLVNNIPGTFHASDLRNYFAVMIEDDAFDCFHFRHRPQFICDNGASRSGTSAKSRKKSLCCLVRFSSEAKRNAFIKTYDKKLWMDKAGNEMNERCFISPIKLEPSDTDKFAKELRPPSFMPKGNVGTRNSHFLNLIRECRLPPSLIRKLGLEFPTGRRYRKYSKVPFDYGTEVAEAPEGEEDVQTARGHVISDVYVQKLKKEDDRKSPDHLPEEPGSDEEADDDRGEEWERHVTFEDDPTSQERIKERLYEEEIELVWEKGGPGIVWYTDAQFWDAQRGGFDEKTADNLDVDMQGYFEEGEGDKDARDLLDMRKSKRFQSGLDDVSIFKKPQPLSTATNQPRWISASEPGASSSGSSSSREGTNFREYGMKVMKKYGWKEGMGLGKTIEGINEPVSSEGQHPRDKRGIGYYGETIEFKRAKKSYLQEDYDDEHRVRIGTIYDKPADLDTPEPLLRSNSISYIKRYDKPKKM